jgi:pyridoxamine 5'-phosphate oxidase
MSSDLSAIRKNYEAGALDEADLGDSPWPLFRRWLDEALAARDRVPEPTAMTLATVGDDQRPSTRIVLLKDADENGFVWYTNFESRKGRELAGNPQAALQFHWVALERVVRIEGRVEKTDDAQADAYYESRPLASRIGAWASEQSQPIASRAVLVARAAEYGLKFGTRPPRPPHWGGYRLAPDRFEFWQGRSSRLHDRFRYRLLDGAWRRDRLAP